MVFIGLKPQKTVRNRASAEQLSCEAGEPAPNRRIEQQEKYLCPVANGATYAPFRGACSDAEKGIRTPAPFREHARKANKFGQKDSLSFCPNFFLSLSKRKKKFAFQACALDRSAISATTFFFFLRRKRKTLTKKKQNWLLFDSFGLEKS